MQTCIVKLSKNQQLFPEQQQINVFQNEAQLLNRKTVSANSLP